MEEKKVFRFEESGEHLTFREFYNQYQHDFPKIVIVVQGYYGEIDMDTFCTDQVMRIHTYTRQKRVIARDINSRTLSIPLDYPMKFRVVESRNKLGEEQYIADIVTTHTLPVQIQFGASDGVSFHIGCDNTKVKSFGNLLVSEVYEEIYLLANYINIGNLDKRGVIVPLYLKDVLVSLTTGIVNMSPDEWKKYLEKIEDDMTRIPVDMNVGYKDIAIYTGDSDGSADDMYDYVEPKYLKFKTTPMEGNDVYEVLRDDGRQTNLVKELSEKQKPEVPKRAPTEKVTSKKPKAVHRYINNIARAEVTPISVKRTLDTEKPEDSQKHIKDLTISELGGRLKQLKLDKYVKAFKDQQIDGSILSEFDESILKQEFHFSAVEAIKLMKFVRSGHIPH